MENSKILKNIKRGVFMKTKEIIDLHTMYHNNRYVYFPSIIDLRGIIEVILKEGDVPKYLRITPFYINSYEDSQIEFDGQYMFFVGKGEKLSEIEYEIKLQENYYPEGFYSQEYKGEYADLSNEDKEIFKKLNPNYITTEVEFKKCLEVYLSILDTIIIKMYTEVLEIMDMKEDYVKAFGYFCFEIHCE